MMTEHLGDLLHGLKAGAHGPGAPRVKEPSGHMDIGEGPEPLEVLPEEIGPNGLQIELHKFRETDGLLLREVLGTFEESPSAVFEEVVLAVLLEGRDFLTPNLIDGLSELFHDMEPVKNVQSLQGLLPDHIQIRPPHIAAHESKPGRAFFPEHLKELEQSVDLSLGSAPEKAPTASIQLIDHGEVLMSLENGDLVHSNLGDPLEGTMGQAIVYNELNGSKDTAPAGLEQLGRFLPGEPSSPSGQKHLVSGGHALFPVGPRDPFGLNPIPGTVHVSRGIPENDPVYPERDVLIFPNLPCIVDGSSPTTDRTFGTTVLPGLNFNDEGLFPLGIVNPGLAKHKRLELLHAIE